MNSNIIKALEEREWIRVVGHRDVPGKPELLATTKAFLDYFGLKRLDELPPLSELKDIGELEPQLQFDDGGAADGMALGDIANAAGAVSSDEAALPSADPENIDAQPASDHIAGAEQESPGDWHDESNDPALAEDGDSDRSTA